MQDQMMAGYVLVEGMDLAGKTSVCKALVASLSPHPELRRNRLADRNAIFDIADRLRRCRDLSGLYMGHLYLAAMALDLHGFSPPERPTVQESTIGLRSLCYYRARGMEDLAGAFERLLDSDQHPRFDRSVVLTASLEVRRGRLEMRRRLAPHEIADDDLAVLTAPELFRRMEDILIEEATNRFGAVVIDTSALTVSQVVTAVAGIVGETLGATDGASPSKAR